MNIIKTIRSFPVSVLIFLSVATPALSGASPSQDPVLAICETESDIVDDPVKIMKDFECALKLEAQGITFDNRYVVWQKLGNRARNILPGNNVDLARILTFLSIQENEKGNFQRSQTIIGEALGIFIALKDDTSPYYAQALYTLAGIETNLQKVSLADQHFLEAQKILEASRTKQAVKILPDFYFQFGIHKAMRGLFLEGASYMERSYNHIVKIAPKDMLVVNSAIAEAGMLSSARAPQAERKAREAIEITRKLIGSAHTEFATALEVLGIELQRQGRIGEAADVLITAVTIKKKNLGMKNMRLGYAMHNLATIKNDLGEKEAGLAIMKDARKIFLNTVGPDNFITINSYVGTAHSHEALGHSEQALKDRWIVLKSFERILDKNHRDLYFARMGLIQSLIGASRYEEALEQAEKGWKVVSATLPQTHIHRLYFQIILGHSKILNGMKKEGWLMVEAGLSLLKEAIIKQRILEKGGKITRFYSSSLQYALAAAYELDKPDAAFEIAQYLLETELAGAAASAAHRLSENDINFAKKHKSLTDKRAALIQLTKTHQKNIIQDSKSQDNIADTVSLNSEIEELKADLKETYPYWSESSNLDIVSLRHIQQKLLDNEALLLTLNDLHYIYSFALTKNRITFDRTKTHLAEVNAKIRNIRRPLSQSTLLLLQGNTEIPPFDLTASYELYKSIFTRKTRKLINNTDQLYIISNATFSSLPFSLLVTEKITGRSTPKKIKSAKWLIKKMSAQRLASIGAFKAVPETSKDSTQQVFIGIGAPRLSGNNNITLANMRHYFRGGKVNLNSLRELPSLPGTKAELERLQILYGKDRSQILTGVIATEENVKKLDFQEANLVVFATHGLVSGQMDSLAEPALVFTPPEKTSNQDDGLLTASEISQMTIPAEWVILSACNTAAGNQVGAAGFTGLGKAFIYAGAKAVLLSHWPVRDDIAARISTSSVFYARTEKYKAKALQKAMLDIMNDKDIKFGFHPVYWAAFELLER